MTAAFPLRARLHHLQLGSPDPQRLARFYGDVFDGQTRQANESWLCCGETRCLVFAPGAPKTLHFAAYAVDDPAMLDGLTARLEQRGIARLPSPTSLLAPDAVAFRDPDGNQIVFGAPQPIPGQPSTVPGRLQHVVVGSPDAARMTDFYSTVVGLRISDRVLDADSTLKTCFLRTDEEHHSFAVFQTAESRFDHHCYELPDWNAIRDWGDRLAARRIVVKWGPGRHGPGNNLFLFFHDPDGNWLEVSAELERVPDGRPAGTWPHEEHTLNLWGQGLLRS